MMVEQFILDRFEEETAVLEGPGRSMTELARALLPEEAQVGDVLLYDGALFSIDRSATEERRRRIAEKMARLFRSGL